MTNEKRQEVLSVMQHMKEAKQSKYLGLPMVIGRSKRQVFDYVRERVISRITNLKEKLLSQVGKEVLLESVVLSLPAYIMSS